MLLAIGLVLAAAGYSFAATVPSTGTDTISSSSLTLDLTSAGNAGAIHGNVNNQTSPVNPSGTFHWFNKPVTVAFTFPDRGGTTPPNLKEASIARNTGTGYFLPAPFVDPWIAEDEGVYSVTATGTDSIGDVPGDVTPAFGIDQTDPVIATDRVPFYKGTALVTVTATDTMSGVENMLITADGMKSYSYEPDPLDPGNFSIAIPFSGGGVHVFKWVGFDNAGNAASGSETFVIDDAAPTTTSDAVAVYDGAATIQLTADDGVNGSGVAHTYYSLDGLAPVESKTVVVPAPANGSDSHVLAFWSVDNMGNTETPAPTASFTVKSTHTITVAAPSNGIIAPSGTQVVNLGANSAAYQISPRLGYHVTNVLVDNGSVGRPTSYQFTNVTANHTLAATFGINTYKITPSRANTHGTISPSAAVYVNYGASKKFTMKPASGYKISKVLVDGHSKGAPTSYTFSNVKAAHAIKVYFVHK